MKNKLLLIIILLVAFVLRANAYDKFPKPGSSFDEYANTFVGMSTIKLGLPIGFTIFPTYPGDIFTNFIFDDIPNETLTYRIVYPWFDHPPLLCLVTGTWAILNGVDKFNDLTVHLIRQPMIFLGVLTVFLIYLLATELFGKRIGLLSAFIASIMPIMVIGSRTAQAENLLIPLSLASLLFLKKYLDKKKLKYLLWTGVFLTLAMINKISGVFLFISIVFILIREIQDEKEKLFNILLIGSFFVLGLLMFIAWGLGLNFRAFIDAFLSNGNRVYSVGFDYLYILLRNETITLVIYLWTSVGLMLSACLLILTLLPKIKNRFFVLIPWAVYMAILILFGNKRFGWYAFPLYPFLAIAGAVVLENLYRKGKNFVLMIAMLFLPFSSIVSQLVSSENVAKYKNHWRFSVFLLIMTLLYFVCSKPKKDDKKIQKIIFWIMTILTIVVAMMYSIKKSS